MLLMTGFNNLSNHKKSVNISDQQQQQPFELCTDIVLACKFVPYEKRFMHYQ